MTQETQTPLLELCDVHVHYGSSHAPLRAVDGVSLLVGRGECVGLVGESGCGKSTLGRALLRLERIQAGAVRFDGLDVLALHGEGLLAYRRRAQMVFQDPYGSLNPRLSIGATLEEVLKVHGLRDREARRAHASQLMGEVGLREDFLPRYPHEFSGGQRQRIGIARALAVQPDLIVADEPVSALDVSVQVQVLNLLRDIQMKRGISILFVAHDLAVVRYISQRVYVMYLGRIVESGPAADLYANPAHPYTAKLLAAVPDVEKGLRRHASPETTEKAADPVTSGRPAQGCSFAPRCPLVRDRCRSESPALRARSAGHFVACHFAEGIPPGEQTR